jgi:hypothetical protein
MGNNLDLHLALFSANSNFRLDLRSFWLFMLIWTIENTHLFLDRRAFMLVCWVFTLISRENTFTILASRCTKCKNVEKNRSKSRNLSNEHLFVLFRGYRNGDITMNQLVCLEKNIRAVLLCQCFCLGKKSIICTKGNWNHVRGLEVLGSLVYFVFKLLLMVGCFCSANSSVMLHMTWICLEPNHQLSSSNNYNLHIPPRCSMYGICMYIYLHLRMSFGVNVDTYSIHGAYGPWYP